MATVNKTPTTPKRKTTTLETKYRAILDVEKAGKTRTKTQIAQDYGVPLNTLSTWLSKADQYKKAFETQEFGAANKRMKKADYEDVDDALDAWMREARARDIPISGPILQAKAQELAVELGHPDFKCSNGWLSRFKTRKGIGFRNIKGEAKAVKPEAVDAWNKTLLPQLLQEYAAEDIYNTDETGLFYKLQPSKSLVYKDEDGRGGKCSKARITVLLTANMTGSHKLQPLVINNCWKPHIFSQKRINQASLPVDFHANKNAWMTGNIFTTWLYKQDRYFSRRGKKVCLVLDNCSAHPNLNSTLKSIKLVFLPPNTTSVTQPMDQGIINNFKCHYRRHFVQNGLLRAMEAGKDFSWNVLDAIYGIQIAWRKVTAPCIANCFRHCHFTIPDPAPAPEEEEDPEDDIPLAQLAQNLRRAGMAVTDEEMAAYQTVDDQLLTSTPLTVQDIAREVQAQHQPEPAQDEEEEDEVPAAPALPPTLAMVMDSTSTLKDALSASSSDTSEMWAHMEALERFFQKTFIQKQRQKSIQEFFRAAPPPARNPAATAEEPEHRT